MTLAGVFLIALGLSMDAFAVSICKGLSVQRLKWKHSAVAGLYFGLFQALMPLVGYFLGSGFSRFIEKVDHWIAFALLALIGANMIRESFSKEEEKKDASFSFRAMLPLAVATSIDALAVGVTFAFLNVRIYPAAALIGITTFVCSAVGVAIGRLCGTKLKNKAELLGGITLIAMGVKILLEHLGVWG